MAITQGRTLTCGTSECCGGSINGIWLGNKADVDIASLTRNANNEVDTLPMNATAVFYKFETKEETSTFSVASSQTACCAIHTVGVTFMFKCIKQSDLDLYKELTTSCCGFVVIIETADGKRFIFGLESPRNAKFVEGSMEIGATLEDANEMSITIQAKQLVALEQLEDGLVIPV